MRLFKKDNTLKGTFHLPASKSISNRLLMIRAINGGNYEIENLSKANDTQLMAKHLSEGDSIIDVQDAGTVMRFLTAYYAATPGRHLLTGSERMMQRPIAQLVETLNELGAQISYTQNLGYPPLLIKGRKLSGAEVSIDASVSSQFISALLLIAPIIRDGLVLNLAKEIVSQPYIDMTTGLMEEAGITIMKSRERIKVLPGVYAPKEDIVVESDWSAASYWLAFAVMADEVKMHLPGLNRNSIQGDSTLLYLMEPFGLDLDLQNDGLRVTKTKRTVLPKHLDFDFTGSPDLAPTFICLCGVLGISATFKGLQTLSIKESDRTKVLAMELAKLGIKFTGVGGEWQLDASRKIFTPVKFSSHNDHRIAMALSIFATHREIEIVNPDVVKKSYPTFWHELKKANFEIS